MFCEEIKCSIEIFFTFPVSTSQPSALRPTMSAVKKSDFGKTADGQAVDLYTLTNANGMTVKVMTYGATEAEAHAKVKALALCVIADRLENGETPEDL